MNHDETARRVSAGESTANAVDQVSRERDELKAAVERAKQLAQAAKPGGSIPPADCTNSCFSDACDCSGNWRVTAWKLDPAEVLAALAGKPPAEEGSSSSSGGAS
jgi:hypothetical protein